MALDIYKRGQGKYTRMTTLLSGSLIGGLIAWYVWSLLKATDLNVYLVYAIPVAIFLGGMALMFWIVNRAGIADFMIATEGEMKKVSWSNRREVIGGTKVVVATTLILAVLLWAVDLAFGGFFLWIGVLRSGGG